MSPIRNDVMVVKECNIDLVRSAIRSLGRATKGELAAYTGISIVSCSKILNDLCAAGEVLLTDEMQIPSVHGRAAHVYQYNAEFSLVSCISFATDKSHITLTSAVADLLGKPLEERTVEITRVNYAMIHDVVQELTARHERLKICAIGIPGSIHRGIIKLCSFPALIDVPLCRRLQDDFPALHFIVENDMNAAAYGLYCKYFPDRETTFGLIFSPNGVCAGNADSNVWSNSVGSTLNDLSLGAGFISQGHILRGFSGFAGEVWSLPAVQRRQAHDTQPVNADVMTDIILSVISILNPEIIVLTGSWMTASLVREIEQRCMEIVSEYNLPQLIFAEQITPDYINGLLHIALNQISWNYRIIQNTL